MKDLSNLAQGTAAGSTLKVRAAGEQETEWFDAQLGQHHYLGAGRPVGDYLRQLVELNGQPVALLVWGPACYALKDRDLWIGWSAPQRELAASAAARLCDRAGGPTAIGYGGARGGGKSHWLLAQMGADDCQRVAGLKCLLLRKVGKANTEHFEGLQRRLFGGLKHEFSAYRGVLRFGNGSQIVAGHYQAAKDIDNYLGLEYDVIGIEEATTLSARKHQDISTCCRTSKDNWRPRKRKPGWMGNGTLPPASSSRRFGRASA